LSEVHKLERRLRLFWCFGSEYTHDTSSNQFWSRSCLF